MGVLYHLRHPLLALDVVGRRVKRLLLLQTLTMPGDERADQPQDLPLDQRARLLDPGWPKLAFVERRLAGRRDELVGAERGWGRGDGAFGWARADRAARA